MSASLLPRTMYIRGSLLVFLPLDTAPFVAHTDPEDRERLTFPTGECLVQAPHAAKMPTGLVAHGKESLLLVLIRLWRCPQDWS